MAVVQACSMKRSGSDYVEKTKKSEVAKRCPLRGPLYRWERSWRRARFWHPSPTRRARGGGRTLLRRQPNGSPGVELVTGPSAVSLFVFVAPVAAFVWRLAGEKSALIELTPGGGALAALFLLVSALLSWVLTLSALPIQSSA